MPLPSSSSESQESAAMRAFGPRMNPSSEVQERIKKTMQARIAQTHAERVLTRATASINPDSSVSVHMWERIRGAIRPAASSSIFDTLRDMLSPSEGLQVLLKARLEARLQPAYAPVFHRSVKWVAAFALVIFVVRLSPLLFLAPHTVAKSSLMLLPIRGEVSVLMEGLWQPVTQELTFTKSALIQTHDGEATLVLHDDGVIRMGPHTTIALHDTSDRPDPALHEPTVTLHDGTMWGGIWLPREVAGVTVATSQGLIEVHEGSFSAVAGDTVEIRVWDRRADVTHEGQRLSLVSGESVELVSDAEATIKKILPAAYDEEWVDENLKRDGQHRKEIAQLQYERRAANAGILPTSGFYTMKRVAEEVDVLLTFGEEAKAQKRLDQANTRLNEAAALLAEGSDQAAVPLAEYKRTLLNIASGSGDGSLVQFMLKQELAEATADIAAALPDDEVYALKKTVLETSAAVPNSFVNANDVQGVLLVDTLSSLMRSVEDGDVTVAKETFAELQPYLAALEAEDSKLSVEHQQEAKASLATFAVAISAYEADVGGLDQEFLDEVSPYLPNTPTLAALPLSAEQIQSIGQAIYDRIFLYKLARSRWNQLLVESRALDGHPDQGRILRWLYRELPENGLARYVKTEFERVKEANGTSASSSVETPL
ncbi:hypothetical protein A3D88_03340 [Candidatus Peribacteria bacterium RIFCSPHIGHO2_02_FULL_52_16]|nr:MAG: hypothetical protein A2706_04160 [Candidatus Peribacteria bacterium RIFCSPHIGHO2_01_FULL_51_35]OGJ61364.1 MAG: hypothetical protein A3D88_03340 [Candidatus Peribacteria bacterium RIFCSPHIGHO2_02_FULL_52_16]